MIKDIAWNMFKSTGNVDTFLELKQIENIQNNLMNMQKVDTDGEAGHDGRGCTKFYSWS